MSVVVSVAVPVLGTSAIYTLVRYGPDAVLKLAVVLIRTDHRRRRDCINAIRAANGKDDSDPPDPGPSLRGAEQLERRAGYMAGWDGGPVRVARPAVHLVPGPAHPGRLGQGMVAERRDPAGLAAVDDLRPVPGPAGPCVLTRPCPGQNRWPRMDGVPGITEQSRERVTTFSSRLALA